MEAGSALPDELARAAVTPREAEVFWLVTERLPNREIADRLVVSVRTVESHVAALLRKLAATDRGQLVALGAAIRARAGARRPLPRPLDSFVARDRELEELRALVAARRLVTLVGPPGAGKSRLALELGRVLPARPATALVDLTTVRSERELLQAFLDALGLTHTADGARATLREALASGDVWLVVDNCEHVGDAAAALLDDLLTSTDTLRALATSQRPLRVAGEAVFPVNPLAVPADDARPVDELLAAPAVRLFCDRAGAAAADVDLTAAARSVAALCRRLDGLPLAIELAAARVRTFAPGELLARLDDRFALLGTGARGRLPRHPTLEAAIAWSYDLLDGTAQRLLQGLSVFAGEFVYDDVVAVIAGPDLSRGDITRAFPELVDRSLVSRRRLEPSTTSYRLLESIRAYASARLGEADPAGALLRRHAEHHLSAAADAGPALLGPTRARWSAWLDRHWADIRQAMRWALTHGEHAQAWRLITGIGFGWEVCGLRGELFAWLDDLLTAGLPADRPAAAAAAQHAAQLLDYQDGDRALALAERAVELADRDGAPEARARSQMTLGWICARSVDVTRAVAALRHALELLPDSGHDWERAFALQGLGRAEPDPAAALEHFAAAAALFAALGDDVKHANVRYMMADTCLGHGMRLDDARRWLAQAEELAIAAGNHHEQLHAAVQMARLDQREGATERARDSLRRLLPAFRRIGDRRCADRCLRWLADITRADPVSARAAPHPPGETGGNGTAASTGISETSS